MPETETAGGINTRRAAIALSLVVLSGPLLIGQPAAAQKVLDRVVARVGNTPIMQTDLVAARSVGVLDAPAGPAGDAEALDRMIERQLVLGELARIPGPEPDASDVDAEVAKMTAAAGPRLQEILQAAGLDERRFREIGRDTVRIRIYFQEKFPPVPVSDGDARRYYALHPEEFTRGGVTLPFAEVEASVREAVAAAGRGTRVTRWLETLRNRVEVVILKSG